MAHAVVTPAPFRRYLSPAEVEAVFGISPRTLEFWRREGRGPSFVRAGKFIKYEREKFDTWMQRQEVAMAG